MAIEMEPFAISTLDDIAEGFFMLGYRICRKASRVLVTDKKDKAFGGGTTRVATRCKCSKTK